MTVRRLRRTGTVAGGAAGSGWCCMSSGSSGFSKTRRAPDLMDMEDEASSVTDFSLLVAVPLAGIAAGAGSGGVSGCHCPLWRSRLGKPVHPGPGACHRCWCRMSSGSSGIAYKWSPTIAGRGEADSGSPCIRAANAASTCCCWSSGSGVPKKWASRPVVDVVGLLECKDCCGLAMLTLVNGNKSSARPIVAAGTGVSGCSSMSRGDEEGATRRRRVRGRMNLDIFAIVARIPLRATVVTSLFTAHLASPKVEWLMCDNKSTAPASSSCVANG